jgi:hypothetical protein
MTGSPDIGPSACGIGLSVLRRRRLFRIVLRISLLHGLFPISRIDLHQQFISAKDIAGQRLEIGSAAHLLFRCVLGSSCCVNIGGEPL